MSVKWHTNYLLTKVFKPRPFKIYWDYSGISKGTFYNYFSSKNELLIALLKTIYKKQEKDRNELLIGKDPSHIEIFILLIQTLICIQMGQY
jgi:hypothetical protein